MNIKLLSQAAYLSLGRDVSTNIPWDKLGGTQNHYIGFAQKLLAIFTEENGFNSWNDASVLEGYIAVLERISNNEEGRTLTHEEIRSLARSMTRGMAELNCLSHNCKQEICALLHCLKQRGLPHYDRQFIAVSIIRTINKDRERRSSEFNPEVF